MSGVTVVRPHTPFKVFEVPESERSKRVVIEIAENVKGKSSFNRVFVEDDEPQFDVVMRNGQSIRVKEAEMEFLGLKDQKLYLDENSGELFDLTDATPKLGSIEPPKPVGA